MTQTTVTQLNTTNAPSPAVSRQAWHEATEAKKLADLHYAKAKDKVDEARQKIKNATQGETLIGNARNTLADLAERQANLERRLDEARAHRDRAAKEVKVAWKAWEPFANQDADGEQPPTVPRVAHLMEQKRREAAAKPAAAKAEEATKHPAAAQVAEQVKRKPAEGLRQLRERVDTQAREGAEGRGEKPQPRAAAKDRGLDLTGATGSAVPKRAKPTKAD